MHEYTNSVHKYACRARSAPAGWGEWRLAGGWIDLCESVWFVEEARLGPGVAGRPGGLHAQQHRVRVAIEPSFDHLHQVSRRASFLPQASSERMHPNAPGLASLGPRLFVHVPEHQHLAGVHVLDHRRHEPLREVWFHRLISSPRAARSSLTARIDSSPKWKIEAARAASAPPAVRASYMCAAVPAPPEAITGRRTAELTAFSRATS